MAHYIHYYAENGDLVDIDSFCSHSCMMEKCRELDQIDLNHETVVIVSQETDYDVFCANCGEFIHHGLQCPNECYAVNDVDWTFTQDDRENWHRVENPPF